MVLKSPLDDLFKAEERILILQASSLETEHDNYVAAPYGGFIRPGSTLTRMDFVISQWTGDVYRAMQYRLDGPIS